MKKRNNKILFFIGFLLIIISLIFLLLYYLLGYYENKKLDKLAEIYIETNFNNDYSSIIKKKNKTKINYIGVLEIPEINFKRGFLNINDPLNTIKKNIQVLENSEFPDKENSVLIIASHSGRGKNAYFKDLDKLSLNNDIYIYYNNVKYIYKITDIYETNKNGNLTLNKSPKKQTLVLTTCSEVNKDKQLVITSELKDTNIKNIWVKLVFIV